MTVSSPNVRVAGHTLDRSALALLLTLGLGVFAGALDLGVLSPALPAIARAFSVSASVLPWVFSIYLLVTVVSIAVMSALADRYGRRAIYVTCVALFAVGSVVAILAPSYGVFLFARGIQALGAGGIFPVATAAIADRIPMERRGAALGLVAATWGLAAIIGPLVGGLITHFFDWRWIFAANFPLAALVIVLALRNVPRIAPRIRGPLDVVGLFFLGFGLLALMAGLMRIDYAEIAAGILALLILAARERQAAWPLIPPQLFTTRNLIVVYGLEVFIGMLEGSLFFVPTVLIAAQHVSYAAAGAIAAIGALVFVAVIPGAGRALDRIGARTVLLAGTAFTGGGLALFAFGFGSLALSICAMIVAGVGFGALLGAPTRYIVTNEAPDSARTTAVGMLSQFLIFGQIIGTSMAGGIIARTGSDIPGFYTVYLAFTAVAAAAFGMTLLLRRGGQLIRDNL